MLVNLHLGSFCSITSFIVVIEVLGHSEGLVFIFAEILQFGQPVAVASFVVDKENKGLRLVALMLHPVNRLIRNNVGNISLFACLATIHIDKVGVVVVTLSRKDVEVVETRGSAYQVPLTNNGSLVTSLLHKLRHCLLRTIKDAMLVVSKTILVAMLTCNHTSTAGAWERVSYEWVYKLYAIGSNAVEVGCINKAIVIAAHHLSCVVVGHNVDHVVALCLTCYTGKHGRCKDKKWLFHRKVCSLRL